jgi:hypothetical protein
VLYFLNLFVNILKFDRGWYIKVYDDVRDSKIPPLLHFIKYGYAEGRLPNSQKICSLIKTLDIEKELEFNPNLAKLVNESLLSGNFKLRKFRRRP